jgi:hypothetical protein
MCFLPPVCLFCAHYHEDAGIDEDDCAAFEEIPDEIFRGDLDHTTPFPGDRGLRFRLNEELREELEEINQLRREMGLRPYPE